MGHQEGKARGLSVHFLARIGIQTLHWPRAIARSHGLGQRAWAGGGWGMCGSREGGAPIRLGNRMSCGILVSHFVVRTCR